MNKKGCRGEHIILGSFLYFKGKIISWQGFGKVWVL